VGASTGGLGGGSVRASTGGLSLEKTLPLDMAASFAVPFFSTSLGST